MALAYYHSNWQPESAINDDDLDHELQSLHDMWNTDDFLVDPINFLFLPTADNSDSHLYDFNYGNGLPPVDNLFNSFQTQPILPHQEFHYPDSFFDPSSLNVLHDYPPLPEIAEPPVPLPHSTAPEFSIGSVNKEGSLSAQSMAARQRRRKITVKTQELGKLIPGGQKMNTAEMLQSAYKYIKFLQAQVALVEFVGSRHRREVTDDALFEGQEEFQKLLESPLIQEKLSCTENCLVPHKFVKELGFDDEILKSNPLLAKDDH